MHGATGQRGFCCQDSGATKKYRFKVEKAFKKRYRQRVSENVRVLETGQLEFVSWEQWKSMDSEPGRSGVGKEEKREGKL